MASVKFCLPEDVVEVLPIAPGFSGFDTLIDRAIIIATKNIQSFCRRTFLHAERIEYFATPACGRSAKLWLSEGFLDTTVAPTLKVAYDSLWTLVDDFEALYYTVDYDTGMIEIHGGTYYSTRALQVTYTAGFEPDPLDNDLIDVDERIRMSCAIQAGFLVDRFSEKEGPMQSKTGRPIPRTITPTAIYGLTPQARQLVNDFRRTLTGPVL
jgi:hypothetical protein